MQIGLGYDLEKILDPVHRDIRLITMEKYQRHLYLKAMATDMALRLVDFEKALVCCVDYTYKSLLSGGNAKEYVWWINIRVIISIFEDYLDP